MKTSPPLTAWTLLQTQNSAPHTFRHGIQGEHTTPQKFTTSTTTQHTRQLHHTLEVLTQTQASTKPSWHPVRKIATTFSRTYPSHSIPQTCTAPPVKKHTTSQFPHPTHQSPLLSATTAFPATWGGEGICLRTIRVEDGSLSEIFLSPQFQGSCSVLAAAMQHMALTLAHLSTHITLCLSTQGSDTQSSNHSTAPTFLTTRSSTSSTA